MDMDDPSENSNENLELKSKKKNLNEKASIRNDFINNNNDNNVFNNTNNVNKNKDEKYSKSDKNIENKVLNKIKEINIKNKSPINYDPSDQPDFNEENNNNNKQNKILLKNVKNNINPKSSDKSLESPKRTRKISKKVTQGDNEPYNKNISDEKQKEEKHTILARELGVEPYHIGKDLANSKCNITYAQLLDLVPKCRSDLTKSLKLDKIKIVSSIKVTKFTIFII